jgi:integrase
MGGENLMRDEHAISLPPLPPSVSAVASGLPWQRALDAWCEQLTVGTRRNYRATVEQFFSAPGMVSFLEDVTVTHLREWRGALLLRTETLSHEDRHLSIASANRYIAALRAFFTYWRRMSPDDAPHLHFTKDQMEGALAHLRGHQKRPYQILSSHEVGPLLEAAASPEPLAQTDHPQRVMRDGTWQRVYRGAEARFAQRDVAIITVALATGLRAAEIAGLAVGDLYESGGCWFLNVRQGKGRKQRQVEIASEDAATLIDYIASTRRNFTIAQDRATPLWESRRSRNDPMRGLSVAHVRKIVDSVADLAQARGDLAPGKMISPHALRHTYAISLLKGNPEEGRRPMTIIEVKSRLGHADIKVTANYVEHIAQEEMAGVVPRISRQRKQAALE